MTKSALRARVLNLVATVCSLAALAALLDPDSVANVMGEFPVGVNGYSQFYAIYVGVRLAIAGLALVAARRADLPVLGDITAMFLLAQPVGRLMAALVIGLPQGMLLLLSGLEIAGGVVLLALRPTSPKSADEIRHPRS